MPKKRKVRSIVTGHLYEPKRKWAINLLTKRKRYKLKNIGKVKVNKTPVKSGKYKGFYKFTAEILSR